MSLDKIIRNIITIAGLIYLGLHIIFTSFVFNDIPKAVVEMGEATGIKVAPWDICFHNPFTLRTLDQVVADCYTRGKLDEEEQGLYANLLVGVEPPPEEGVTVPPAPVPPTTGGGGENPALPVTGDAYNTLILAIGIYNQGKFVDAVETANTALTQSPDASTAGLINQFLAVARPKAMAIQAAYEMNPFDESAESTLLSAAKYAPSDPALKKLAEEVAIGDYHRTIRAAFQTLPSPQYTQNNGCQSGQGWTNAQTQSALQALTTPVLNGQPVWNFVIMTAGDRGRQEKFCAAVQVKIQTHTYVNPAGTSFGTTELNFSVPAFVVAQALGIADRAYTSSASENNVGVPKTYGQFQINPVNLAGVTPDMQPYDIPSAVIPVSTAAPAESAPTGDVGGGEPTTGEEAPATTSGGTISYTVVAGDTMYGLATRYGTTAQAIADANKTTLRNLEVGEVLIIPGQ